MQKNKNQKDHGIELVLVTETVVAVLSKGKKSRKEIDVNTVRRLLSRKPSIRICKAELKVPNDCFNAFKLLAMVFFFMLNLCETKKFFFLSRVTDRLSVISL